MLISIGKCYKTYFFILGSALFKLLSLILTGDGKNIKILVYSAFVQLSINLILLKVYSFILDILFSE